MIILMRKLTQEEAQENISQIEAWFKVNPKRRVCRSDLFKVRRGHVSEDVMKHADRRSGAGQDPQLPESICADGTIAIL